MRSTHCLTVGLSLLSLLAVPLVAVDKVERTWTFDDDPPGTIARGFTARVGEWKVVDDGSNRVLAQQARSPDDVFNVILVDEPRARDLTLTVRMKAVAGQDDQGGGLIWRARDERNYYIARHNPLEDNYRVYKVVDGRRTMLQSADIRHGDGWHTLRVEMEGDHITCSYDGRPSLDVRDSTFAESGRIGLWSKADARSFFDDLTLVGR